MIAIVRFKKLPGRRFEVVKADPGFCIVKYSGRLCALIGNRCSEVGAYPHCTKMGLALNEIKKEK